MPRVSIGMKEVCAPALFADLRPATPSIAPLPKRSGVLRDLLLDRVGREGGEERPAAGKRAEERADQRCRARSARPRRATRSRLGIRPVILPCRPPSRHRLSRLRMISAKPKMPMRHGDDFEAVGEVDDAEGEALKRRCRRPSRPCRRACRARPSPTALRSSRARAPSRSTRPSSDQREVLRRPELAARCSSSGSGECGDQQASRRCRR